MRLSSKNKEKRPRGSLGKGTLGPACLSHGVTFTGCAVVDHAIKINSYYFLILILVTYSYLLFQGLSRLVTAAVTHHSGCCQKLCVYVSEIVSVILFLCLYCTCKYPHIFTKL